MPKAASKAASTAASLLAAGLSLGCGRAEVSVLTYNVAGLAEGVSRSHPAANTPRISPLLNGYDVVLAQEDFNYHPELSADATHEFQFPPKGSEGSKSGLSRFSRLAMSHRHAETWRACHGAGSASSDCLAPKGFSVAEHRVGLGSSNAAVDIVNLHMDAGDSAADRSARADQVEQLLAMLEERASFKAVVVAGDFNISDADDPLLLRLRGEAGLIDACRQLDCPDPERIDRVLYRSSRWVVLEPTRWWSPEELVDAEGEPLSDHLPVAVSFVVSAPAPTIESGR